MRAFGTDRTNAQPSGVTPLLPKSSAQQRELAPVSAEPVEETQNTDVNARADANNTPKFSDEAWMNKHPECASRLCGLLLLLLVFWWTVTVEHVRQQSHRVADAFWFYVFCGMVVVALLAVLAKIYLSMCVDKLALLPCVAYASFCWLVSRAGF